MQRYNFFSTFASIHAIKFGLCPKGAFCVAFCFVKCGFRPVAGGVCPLSSRSRRFRASERWAARYRRSEASAPICAAVYTDAWKRRLLFGAAVYSDARKRRLLLGDIVVRGKSTGGAKENRRGVTPPAPERSEEPPVQEHQRNKSPEGATEYLTCLISTCIYFCRPLGAFSVVASLPGACAPVCGLSSLRDLR